MNQFMTGQSLIVFGLAVVIFVFLMRRTLLRTRNPAPGHHAPRATEEIESAEMSAEAVVEKLEVRLFDFAREVEGRMQTRIAVLDRLIIDADREILRLQDLLAATMGIGGAGLLAGTPADPQATETSMTGKMPSRHPDIMLPDPPPAEGSQREAA